MSVEALEFVGGGRLSNGAREACGAGARNRVHCCWYQAGGCALAWVRVSERKEANTYWPFLIKPVMFLLWFYVDFAANFYTSNTANAGHFLQCETRNIAVAGLNLNKLGNLYLSTR